MNFCIYLTNQGWWSLCHIQGGKDLQTESKKMYLHSRMWIQHGQVRLYHVSNPEVFLYLTSKNMQAGRIGYTLLPAPLEPCLGSHLANWETPLAVSRLGVVSSWILGSKTRLINLMLIEKLDLSLMGRDLSEQKSQFLHFPWLGYRFENASSAFLSLTFYILPIYLHLSLQSPRLISWLLSVPFSGRLPSKGQDRTGHLSNRVL